MTAKIHFIYYSEMAFECEAENSTASIESEIRYWLGKSPGIHKIEKIIAVPEDQEMDYTYMLQKIREEEDAISEARKNLSELAEYERLKVKFGQSNK